MQFEAYQLRSQLFSNVVQKTKKINKNLISTFSNLLER